MPPYGWANGDFVGIFGGMVSIVLVLWQLVLFYEMDVEFNGEIILRYSRRVKWLQGFTIGIGFYVCNVLGLPCWMDHMV